MSGRNGLIASIAAIFLAASGSGCVCSNPNACGLARDAGPNCELPTCLRNQVYVFALSGVNPVEAMSLGSLRDQLNRRGYAKVGTGQTVYAEWVASEMRRIKAEEPDAVVVLIGTEGAAGTTMRLAEKANAEDLPLAGVAIFDRKSNKRVTVNNTRIITIPNTSISSGESVGIVAEFLNEIAMTTPHPKIVETPSTYEFAPEPRPTLSPGPSPEWAFLFDHGSPTQVVAPNEVTRGGKPQAATIPK
jgi:hypothetical protein